MRWLAVLPASIALAACGSGDVGDTTATGSGAGGDASAVSSSASTSSSGEGGAPAIPIVAYAHSCDVEGHAGTCLARANCTGNERMPTPMGCDGAPSIECCTDAFAVMCDPMAMLVPNEYLVEEPGDPGCPDGMAMIAGSPSFCVDRYEGALVFTQPSSPQSWSPYFNPKSQDVRAVSLRNAVPQGYINQVEAAAACDKSGKHLCTDDEWLRACQGPTGTTYPYGDTRMTGVCNDHRDVHPAVEYFGTTDPSIFSHLDEPCLDQLYKSLDRTGQSEGCITAEGAFDMMGNLHEWTADPAGTFRGGFFVDTVKNGNGCLYKTTAHTVTYWDYSTGFRCCF